MQIKCSELESALRNALPHVFDTGKVHDLAHIKPDPVSNGKAVLFMWDKREFRLTVNLGVDEFPFGYASRSTMMKSETTKELECKIQKPFVNEQKRLEKNAKERARKAAKRATGSAVSAVSAVSVVEQEKQPIEVTQPAVTETHETHEAAIPA
jgi:hypothetical protein